MPIRSMTGFAQVKGEISAQVSFTLSLKSVNHRFLDLHLRMPGDSGELEMKLRRRLKERIARGHVELTLAADSGGSQSLAIDHDLVSGYVQAFRAVAREFAINAEPDLNVILKLPGAFQQVSLPGEEGAEAAILTRLDEAISRLDKMRVEEGQGIEKELRERMAGLEAACQEVEKYRAAVVHAYMEKVQSRMQELLGGHFDRERVLQEAALLAERSDIHEELVRMQTHIRHFRSLLESSGEVGKKLDFLLQEMAREANTLLSKTSGVAGEALRITELGLAMKAEIEKSREQVQNVE
jgi:uncharacterized protein (TIGR00255 family)